MSPSPPNAGVLKPVEWMGSARDVLRALPEEPRRVFGYAIHLAQLGRHHRAAKRLKGEFAGLVEVVDSFDGNAYRVIYTLKLVGVVYVLHVFQKKATRGIAMPKRESAVIRDGCSRRKSTMPNTMHSRRGDVVKRRGHSAHRADKRSGDVSIMRGSGNVYADLEFEHSDEEFAKAQLAVMIDDVITERGLTQTAAAALMGIDQPKVSHILHGRLGGFSTQRLMEFLTALGRDVEIVVSRTPRTRKRGRLRIAAS